MNDHLCLTLISPRPSTKRERDDSAKTEKVLRDGCQERLQRYQSGRTDAAPVVMYERGDLP